MSTLGWLLGDPHKALTVFYSATDNLARYKMTSTILEHARCPAEEKTSLGILLKEWRSLSEERNVIIHGSWYLDYQTRKLFRQGNERDIFIKLTPEFGRKKRYSLEDLEDCFRRMQSCTSGIMAIVLPLDAENFKRRLNEP
jgi:hypothetical protein